jgi:hypothetical protein
LGGWEEGFMKGFTKGLFGFLALFMVLSAARAFAGEAIAPANAVLYNIPMIRVEGNSYTDTTEQRLIDCRKHYEATLTKLESAALVIVQKQECAISGAGVYGSISFLR